MPDLRPRLLWAHGCPWGFGVNEVFTETSVRVLWRCVGTLSLPQLNSVQGQEGHLKGTVDFTGRSTPTSPTANPRMRGDGSPCQLVGPAPSPWQLGSVAPRL